MDTADGQDIGGRLAARLGWQSPTDQRQAEQCVRDAYRAAGSSEPEHIVWAAGPKDARRILARLSWFRWIPPVALAFALAAALVDVAAGLVWDGWTSQSALVIAWHSGLAATSAILLLGLLSAEWLRCASSRAVYAGLMAGLAALAIAPAIVPDGRLVLSAPGLLMAVLVCPTLAVVIERRRETVPRVSGRSGALVHRPIRRVLRRALRGSRYAPMNGGVPPIVAVRGPAFADLMQMLVPGGIYPVEILLRHPLPHLPGSDGAPWPPSGVQRVVMGLLFHVDALWAFKKCALVLAPPVEVHVDELGRLHNATGAAVRWQDGCELFAIDGQIPLDPRMVLEPDRLSVHQIFREPNPGLRRVLIERFGPERFMRALGGRKIAEDAAGELWRAPEFDGEPLVMVRVLNSTPEPDGSQRVYWLRVPPEVTMAREGVAWTFGLDAQTYRPGWET
ncbi:MAG TPA: hypothetical protein VD978_07110 [Azospirillum sp.]|nr:hypothetical protein [Azospirillum sp.]